MFRNGCCSAVTSASNSLAAALSAAGREWRSAPAVSVRIVAGCCVLF